MPSSAKTEKPNYPCLLYVCEIDERGHEQCTYITADSIEGIFIDPHRHILNVRTKSGISKNFCRPFCYEFISAASLKGAFFDDSTLRRIKVE